MRLTISTLTIKKCILVCREYCTVEICCHHGAFYDQSNRRTHMTRQVLHRGPFLIHRPGIVCASRPRLSFQTKKGSFRTIKHQESTRQYVHENTKWMMLKTHKQGAAALRHSCPRTRCSPPFDHELGARSLRPFSLPMLVPRCRFGHCWIRCRGREAGKS